MTQIFIKREKRKRKIHEVDREKLYIIKVLFAIWTEKFKVINQYLLIVNGRVFVSYYLYNRFFYFINRFPTHQKRF